MFLTYTSHVVACGRYNPRKLHVRDDASGDVTAMMVADVTFTPTLTLKTLRDIQKERFCFTKAGPKDFILTAPGHCAALLLLKHVAKARGRRGSVAWLSAAPCAVAFRVVWCVDGAGMFLGERYLRTT